ncbi:titin homolog isoform X12 [Helianthus annuus]|uniref:titin homolog isoform X12 n=1 Tax=Helianthus annuus TaxID=4232 RepID=UPI000B8EEB25|nr:titin homolog isoform X12 [Helianthus annuus]
MATEANIQESVLLKKGEREENALTSESFEEKATELPGNQVKQLETSSLVATTVYTPLETGTGKPTDESGIFFQALSVTMVIADEHSNTPESYKAAKPTEPEEETIKIGEKAIQSEVCGNSVPEKSETDSVEQGKKEAFNVSEKNQGDGYGVTSSQDAVCEDIKETTEEHAAVVADFKEQDLNETPREFVKEETDDKSVDAQEASELSEIGSKDTEEQKYEESVKKIEQDEEIEDTKPDVEIAKTEQNGLLQAITPDACASTQTIPQVETTEHEEKEQVVNILEKDQDKDDVTRAQEVTVEGGLQEKTHHNDDNEREVVEAKESVEEDAADVCVSTLVKESTKNEEPDDEKAIEKEVCEENVPKKAELEGEVEISDSVAPIQNQTLSTIEKDQGGTDGVTSLQEPPCVDVEETTTVQHVTTTIDFKEQDLNEKPREFVKEETEDKSLDAQEANEECEKEAKEEIDQNSEESVKKIEKEEETEEIKPAITTDDCIMTETKSQVEKTEHEEENTQKDEGLKEKSDSPSIEEVCEETSLEKDEYVKEVKDSATETVTKDENEDVEKEQEVNVLETHEGKVDVTSAQDVTIEKDLQEKDHHNEDEECEVVTTEESTEKDTEVIRSSETTEQQMLTNAVPSDVCISTQTEPQEEATEKNDVEVLNENETLRKDEDQEKEQEICVTEKVQSGGDDVTSSENASNEQEQHAEEIKPSVETTEEKDVCIPTQIESQEKPTKNEESAIQNDGDQKEKSDDPSINEVCEENDLKKTESEEEIKPSDSSVVTTRESVIETTEETKSSDETKENIEQQGVLNVIPTDNDDGQTDKHESPLVEVVCEETSSKTAEPEDVKHSDGSSTTLNEKETPDKEESLEKEDDIKTSEVHGGGDDVTSLQNVSNDDIKETLTDQHDTNAAYVEEGQGVIAKPKEILIEEAEDRSIDAEELGQPNEQNVEETLPTISENPEDEIKKEDKDLSHESVEDTNDHTTKEEKCTLEQEHVKEHTDQDKVSTEKVTDLNETKEVEPKEEIIPSTALSASTEATSNSEKEKAEGEKLPTEDLEIVSEEQIPELVPKSEEPVLKETTETHVDEEKGTVTKEISSAEKTEVQSGGDAVTSSQNASDEEIQETMIGQHDTTVTFVEEGQGVSATPKEILIEEAEDKSIVPEEIPLELAQPSEQNVEEAHSHLSKSVTENPEDEIKKEDKELSHETVKDTNDDTTKEEKCTVEQEPVEVHSGQDEVSKEKVTDLNETSEVEPKEEITPSTSLETSTEDTPNTEKEKAESENLPIEDLKTVSEVQIPESVPELEEPTLKEKCIITETETQLDEEKGTVTEEISSDEKTELTTEIKQESVKEVCEETSSEKTELQEGLKLSDDSNVKINEKEITTFKEDEQEKDQEVNTSAESQGGNNITSSQNEESEEKEELKEKNYHNEGNEGDFTESGERVEEDTREIKSSVETKDTETNDAEHVISTSSSTHIEDDEEAIEKDEKKDETAIENDKNETVSTEENLEKKQEDIKETNTGEHATTMAYFEEEQSLSTITKEAIGKAEEGDKSVIFQEKTEQCDEENVEREQKAEEYNDEIKPSVETTEEKDVCISTQTESHVEPTKKEENAIEPDGERKENPDNPFVKEVCEESDLTKTESEERQPSDSFDVKTTEEDTEETKSSDETKENKEQQGVLDVIATDVSGSTQTEHVEKTTASHEENDDEETIEQDKGQTEKPEIPLVEVACETTKSEIVESEEEVKQSNSFSTTLNENEILSKEEKLEKEDEIKTSEIEVGEVEVTSSQNASNDDVKETTLDQDITAVAHVEEGSGVSALPKEILIEEAEDKSVDAEEISLELGQPNEQNVEETLPCPTKSINDNLEDEIKKEDRDLSHESVEDTNDDTKEERRTLEHEHLEEHSGQDEVSKEKVTDLHETTEAELKEDITPSISLETSTEDASNLENEKAEVESFPIENLETVSEVQIPELVPGSEETVLKNECLTSETETHLDEEKESITENNSSDEVSKELEQTKEQNVEETEACVTETISEKTEDKITKDEDSSHDRTDHINENITKEEKCFPDVMTKEIDISTLKHEPVEEQNDSQDEVSKEILTVSNETIAVEPKEDITPSSSLGTSAEDTSNSDKAKTVSESLPLEDLESVSEVHIPDVMPKSEDLKMEEECLVSETETYANEENRVATKEISSYENLETHGSTQQPENSYSTTENQLNSAEDCIKTEKDVILTKEIEQVPLEIEKEKEVSDFKEQIVEEDTYSPELEEKSAQNQKETVHEISVENPEVTEVNVDAQIGQKDLQGKEDISCVSKVTTDITDQEPKEEKSPSLEDGATLESVDLSNTDSTAYPSESEKLATRALESDCDVQIPEVVADSEDSKVKEECIVLEQDTKTNEISSALDKEEENVTKAPTESDEAKSSDLIIEENASTKEASEQCDDVAKDKIEQPEEGVNKPVNSCSETTEGSIKEEEPYAENKEIETELEAENQADRTEDRTEMTDETVLTEKVSKELEQTKEQNVEETEACVTEDKITKDEDSSPDSTEHINENITKEEKCFPDVMTKETDISTLKHEPVEEQNDSQDEVPKEILTVSNETIAVEPKEDIPPSSSLGTSAQNQKETVHEISVENPEVTEVNVDAQIGQKDLQGKEDISCVSKVTNDITDQEENASTKENREIHGELEPTYEPVIEEQVTIETKPQLEQSDITSENITNDQTSESKLEHTSAKDTEEDDRLAPEIETKGIENLHETTKNIILTDEEVAVETEKEKERNEIEKQVSDTELDSTPTPVQKELANEQIEYSKPIPVGNIEVTEVKAESQIEVENTQAAEDLSCLSKASSVTEKSKAEIREDPQQTITVIGEVKDDIVDEASEEKIAPVLEDSKASERQVNLPEIESTDTPSNGRDTMKLEEDVSCKTRETIEEQIALTSQLADREILEEKDDKPISERSSSRTDELLGTKDSVEDTKDAKFTAENLSVTDETITEIKKSNEDSEIVASEFKKSEDTVTEKEKETLDEPHTDDSEKPTYDSILSSEIATEAAKIVPECINAPAILTDNLPEASPEMLLAKPEDKITEDPEVLPSVEKDVTDVQKHEKDLDHETEVKTADVVSNVECSEIEPRHFDTNQVNQKDKKKEADESIKDVIPVEDVKTSTRELEVGSVDLEVPSVIDATADDTNYKTLEVHEAGLLKDDKHLESACDQSKSIEEGSGIKQEPLKLDASETLDTAAAEDLTISQKYVPDDLINISQTHPEVQNREVPACTVDKQSPKESTEVKILTEKMDTSDEQAEPVAKSLVPEAGNLKVNTTVSVDQKEKSESVEKEESGVKTDEEDEEEEDHEEDEKTGSCSDAPVMVEASQDMEVKAHKKSHNILSGVGSKVKHSIAKVKKAITGKSSPTKSTSPKAKNQVTG